MRLLHTSDWHVGKRLHGIDLLDAQADFTNWLVEVVASEGIDAVVVAGDLYDRSNPATDAVRLFDEAVGRLVATGVPLLMISGNHDSPTRVGMHAGLLGNVGVHVATDPNAVDTPVVLADDHGEIAFYGLPYLDPVLAREPLGADAASHTDVMGAAMARVRADLTRRPGTRAVVIAHAFAAGGSVSDSERDIAVGGAASVPVALFDGITYTALGHLHGPQDVGAAVRYSGSPLAYSFSEEHHTKSVTIVELDATGGATTTTLATPVPRPLVTLTGTLEQLCTDASHTPHEQAWVRAVITDPLLPVAPMEKLRQRFRHALHLEHRPPTTTEVAADTRATRIRNLDDLSLTTEFFTELVGSTPDDAQGAVLAEAVEASRRAHMVDQ